MMRIICTGLAAVVLFLHGCTSVPVTGRSQLSLIPASTMLSMSYQQYGEFMKTNPPSADSAATRRVRQIGDRIRKAVEAYAVEKNFTDRLKGYQWEFNLVASPEVNAWCMPGGKVVVYEGLLPVAKTDAGLAVVMGHEIAHAVAEHGGERMSQGLLTQLGGMGLAVALEKEPAETRNLWLAAFGAGAQVGVLLPFSRTHESEADRLGLIFMAMAGYDPQEAVAFWTRMSESKKGGAPPEFLSTHPSDRTRIEDIRKALPEAMAYYKPR
jgi:predicted Zn-dependent protease